MDLNSNAAAQVFRVPSRRLTGGLIRTSLGFAVLWFAYQLAARAGSAPGIFQEAPSATIAFLALALAVAAYAAMRQQAYLVKHTQAMAVRSAALETDKLGLIGVIEAASDAVVITDRTGSIQYVNPAFAKLTGYDANDLAGQFPRLSRWGIGAALHKQMRLTLSAGNTWRGEINLRRKDGRSNREEVTVTPVCDADGVTRKYIAMVRDRTARQVAQETQAMLASIVESSEDAILSSSPEGMIASWNGGAQRLYGYTAAEVTGKPVSMLAPADQRARLKFLSDTLERGESISQFEGVALTKEGNRIDISISACPIRNSSGEITARAAIMRDITARVQAQKARALLASIVDAADDAIFGTAPDGAILSWNHGAEAIYGYSADEMLGKSISILAPAGQIAEITRVLEQVRQGETVSQWETVTLSRAGQPVDVSLTISPVRDAAGSVVGLSTVARDIRRRLLDREALHRSEERYRTLIANLPDIAWVADESGRAVFVSSNSTKVVGYTPEEICQPDFWSTRVHPQDLARREEACKALFEDGQPMDVEYRFQRRDGTWIWLHSRADSVYEHAGKHFRDGLVSDITARKNMEQKVAYQATHDVLTGLPNRAAFEDRFRQALARAKRHAEMAAILYLDLDRFKRINDTLGHAAGDVLLRLTAQRLSACLRASETISRSGGDRFVAILSDMGDPQEAVNVAERILAALAAPFSVKGSEVFLSGSVGIALYPQHGHDPASLQQAAENALSIAKRQGKHRVQLSTPEFGQAANRRLEIETELHYALERDELTLHYQPQFDVATNRIVGVEALVRWNNPKLGQVPPSVLIPIAEESGLIVQLGTRVLREACRQTRLWHLAGYGPLQVAVNTSAVQFARDDLATSVAAILAETGLAACHLDLEVTESVIMQDLQETVRQLRELKKLGVSVSLDDFGTGYSSLSYLEELPIDNLKIDRRFVQRLDGSDNTRTLVEAIVGLAHGLGMRAVAEGVDNMEQLDQLKAMGCDRAQSFMLAPPASAHAIQALLARSRGRVVPRAVA